MGYNGLWSEPLNINSNNNEISQQLKLLLDIPFVRVHRWGGNGKDSRRWIMTFDKSVADIEPLSFNCKFVYNNS